MMFNRRSEFLYQALTPLDCMAMRRSNYQELQERYGLYMQKLKVNMFNRYKDLVRKPLIAHKRETLSQI